MYPRVKKFPTGYVITIDGEVMEDAGKKGVISNYRNAKWLADFMEGMYPESDVFLFGVFEMTKLNALACVLSPSVVSVRTPSAG